MALETLKGITEIGGFSVGDATEWTEKINGKDAFKNFIIMNRTTNAISFTIQNGPIKEFGINGAQVDSIIEAAKLIIEGLNKQFPCRENSMVITKLDEALMWSLKRKMNREMRGVEGTSNG